MSVTFKKQKKTPTSFNHLLDMLIDMLTCCY